MNLDLPAPTGPDALARVFEFARELTGCLNGDEANFVRQWIDDVQAARIRRVDYATAERDARLFEVQARVEARAQERKRRQVEKRRLEDERTEVIQNQRVAKAREKLRESEVRRRFRAELKGEPIPLWEQALMDRMIDGAKPPKKRST